MLGRPPAAALVLAWGRNTSAHQYEFVMHDRVLTKVSAAQLRVAQLGGHGLTMSGRRPARRKKDGDGRRPIEVLVNLVRIVVAVAVLLIHLLQHS